MIFASLCEPTRATTSECLSASSSCNSQLDHYGLEWWCQILKSFEKKRTWGPQFLKIAVNLKKLLRKRRENPPNQNGKIITIKKTGQKLINTKTVERGIEE